MSQIAGASPTIITGTKAESTFNTCIEKNRSKSECTRNIMDTLRVQAMGAIGPVGTSNYNAVSNDDSGLGLCTIWYNSVYGDSGVNLDDTTRDAIQTACTGEICSSFNSHDGNCKLPAQSGFGDCKTVGASDLKNVFANCNGSADTSKNCYNSCKTTINDYSCNPNICAAALTMAEVNSNKTAFSFLGDELDTYIKTSVCIPNAKSYNMTPTQLTAANCPSTH